MHVKFTLIRLFAASTLILQLATLIISAAAPQEVPRRRVHVVDRNHDTRQGRLQARFYPYPPILNMSALPVEPAGQTYVLGPSMTIDGNLIVPEILSGGNSIPLLLDTLSACTWLPTRSIRCYHTSDVSNSTNATSNPQQGDSCMGISAVGLPGRTGNSSSTIGDSSDPALTAEVACPHYLAGFVAGPVLRTYLNLAGKSVSDAQVLFAEGFYSKYGLSLHEFAQYHGGASGVLGLGMYDALWNVKALNEGRQKWSGELVTGVLRELFLQDGEGQKQDARAVKRAWSLALPRRGGGAEGNGGFVVGGQVSNDTAETTGEEIVVSLSSGVGWGDVGLVRRMLYALSRVGFSVGDGDGAATAEVSEEYFLDSALPVIYTSQQTAEKVLSLFSPAGVFDNTTGLYVVDCSATAPASISIIIEDGYGGNLSIPVFPEDLIVPLPLDKRADGACISAFQVNADYPGWRRLGWAFFRNIVVTVDIDQWAARISARTWPRGSPPPASSSTPTLSSTASSSTSAMASVTTVILTSRRTFTTSNIPTTTMAQSTALPDPTASSSSVVSSQPPTPPTPSDPLSIAFSPTATNNTITTITSNSSEAATSIMTPPGVTTIRTLPNSEALDNAPDLGVSPPPFSWPTAIPTTADNATNSATGARYGADVDLSGSDRGGAAGSERARGRTRRGEARSVADEESGDRVLGTRRGRGRRAGGWWPLRWKLRERKDVDDGGEGGGKEL